MSERKKNIFIGILWAFISAFLIIVFFPIILIWLYITLPIGKIFSLILGKRLWSFFRRVHSWLLTPWHTLQWYTVYYGVIMGLYNILDLEYYHPWMGIGLKDFSNIEEYISRSSKNVRKLIRRQIPKKIEEKGFQRRRYLNEAPWRMMFHRRHWQILFEKCKRVNDDLFLAFASFVKLFLTSVIFPVSIDEYYLKDELVGFMIYGVKGQTFFLAECATTNDVKDCMLFHHMHIRGVQDSFDLSLDFLCAGYGNLKTKSRLGFRPVEGLDAQGFSLKPFKIITLPGEINDKVSG